MVTTLLDSRLRARKSNKTTRVRLDSHQADSRFCGFYSVFLKDVKSADRSFDRSQKCRQLALSTLIVFNAVPTLLCMFPVGRGSDKHVSLPKELLTKAT